MGNEWYYVKSGKQLGPFSWFQLGQLAKSGVLQPADLIAQAGTPHWVAASTVPGLFDSAIRPATECRAPSAPSASPTWQPVTTSSSQSSGRFVAIAAAAGVLTVVLGGGLLLLLVLLCAGLGGTSSEHPASIAPATATQKDRPAARIRVSALDGTSELQRLFANLPEEQLAALGLAVVVTGVDTYAANVRIRNSGNVPIRISPEKLHIHYGGDSVQVFIANHAAFLRSRTIQPGETAEGLVMYRARVDVGAEVRLFGGGISYDDTSLEVTYDDATIPADKWDGIPDWALPRK